MELLKLMAKKLGLAETATEQEIQAALDKALKPVEIVACKEVLTALELAETAGKSEVVASIHALKQTLQNRPDMTQEVANLKTKLAQRERDELVAAAIKAGKITPAQKEWAEKYALNDAEGFKLFVAKAPVVVPVEDVKLAEDPRRGDVVTDETTLAVAKLFGNSAEDLKKYGQRAA